MEEEEIESKFPKYKAPNCALVPDVFFDYTMELKTSSQIRVYWTMVYHVFKYNKINGISVSIKVLSGRLNLTERTTERAIKYLIENGYLKKIKKGEIGNETCIYFPLVKKETHGKRQLKK